MKPAHAHAHAHAHAQEGLTLKVHEGFGRLQTHELDCLWIRDANSKANTLAHKGEPCDEWHCIQRRRVQFPEHCLGSVVAKAHTPASKKKKRNRKKKEGGGGRSNTLPSFLVFVFVFVVFAFSGACAFRV